MAGVWVRRAVPLGWLLIWVGMAVVPVPAAGEWVLTWSGLPPSPYPEGQAPFYRLTKGQQFKLCQRLEENLRRFPEMDRWHPCSLPLHPDFPEFGKPDWEPLDPRAHPEIMREIYLQQVFSGRFGTPRKFPGLEEQEEAWKRRGEHHFVSRYFPDGRRVDNTVDEALENGNLRLEKARFDLNHDGKPETVYRMNQTNCIPSHGDRWNSFYWSQHVLQKEDPLIWESFRTLIYGNARDIFFHEGRTYLAGLSSPSSVLMIDETFRPRSETGGGFSDVCIFKLPTGKGD